MFGIGMPELMVIFVLALLVFGPKELPKIARTLGKAMAELRRTSDELRDGIQREIDLASREEETSPPPGAAVPTTPPAEGVQPSPNEETGDGAVGGTLEASLAPSETAAPVAQEDAAASVKEGEGRPIGTEESTSPGSPLEADKALGPADEPGDSSTQTQAAPHVPAQPAETRNV